MTIRLSLMGATMAAALMFGAIGADAGQGTQKSGSQRPPDAPDNGDMLVVEDVMHTQRLPASSMLGNDGWFRVITAAVGVRYRTLDFGNAGRQVSQIQLTQALRGVVNADRRGRVTVNGSVATGRGFNGGWNTTGIGKTGSPTYKVFLKQLFVAARLPRRLTIETGGLSLVRGESTEATSYDNDG